MPGILLRYCFGPYVLDTNTFELLHEGTSEHVEPQTLHVLEYLVRHRSRAVSKDELMEQLWRGRVISDATLANCIKQARHVLGDSGAQQKYIRTARGRGYQFVGTATEATDEPVIPERAVATTPTPVRNPLPSLPSLALLGFDNVSSHPSGSVFTEGLAVDLNARLARLHGLFVTARSSARRLSPQTLPLSEIAARLGVRYLVHGAVQRLDGRIRVTVFLVDAASDAIVWTDHFDRTLDDIFAIQDDIVGAIISALVPELERAEMERARLVPTEKLDAWECYHQAMWHNFRFTAQDSARALELLHKAIGIDPQFSRAYAGLSFNHFNHAFLNATNDVAGDIARCVEMARQSVQLDVRDAMSHWVHGRALFLAREHTGALDALDRALQANPNYAQCHYARGFVGVHAGLPEQALTELDKARRLSPFDPLLFAMKSCRAISLAVQGDEEQACQWAVNATQEPNAHFHIHAIASACLQMSGRKEQAQAVMQRTLQLHPGYSIAVFERSFPHHVDAHRELFRDAFTELGLTSQGTDK